MKCECGKDVQFKVPAVIVEITNYEVPIVQLQCACGKAYNVPLTTMKPYEADRCEKFPAHRGEYQVAPGGGVNFTCPVCKSGFSLKPSTVHSIEDDGKVTPSVICPNKCGFHTWVTLKDWKVL